MKLIKQIATAIACAVLAAPAAAQIDFSTSAGRERTCERYLKMDAKRLARHEDKAAFAICGLVDLVRDGATWARTMQAAQRATSRDMMVEIRSKAEEMLLRVDELAAPLETVRAAKPLFVIRPGEWVVDWDGDGVVSPFERYLLWVPRRDVGNFLPAHRFGAPDDYYQRQFLAPVIAVDQADVHWLLAYLHFGRGALNLLLSYDIDLTNDFRITLKDAGRVRTRAYPHMLAGIRHSTLLRGALLKETDDQDEWIPNPKQQQTSFPLVMDPQTFATWGELLGHMEKLFRGQTLLGGTVEQGATQNVRDLTMGMCPPGQGINLRDLFIKPLPQLWGRDRSIAERCVPPTTATPFSGLAAMVAASVRRNANATGGFSGEQMILRHFMWVN